MNGDSRSTDTGKHDKSESKAEHGDLRGQQFGLVQVSAVAGVVSV
jgi:hypothetical protein